MRDSTYDKIYPHPKKKVFNRKEMQDCSDTIQIILLIVKLECC
jgi:hypothetical protein